MLVATAALAALLAPSQSPAAISGGGPVVLPSRDAVVPLAKTKKEKEKEIAGPPTPPKGKTKPDNPFEVEPPQESDGPAGSKEKEEPAAGSLPPAGFGTKLKEPGEDGQVDPINGLGLRNPLCDALGEIRDRRTRLACELNGAPESHYPSTNYGFDTFIDTGIDAPMGTGLSIIARLLNGVWLGVNFILRCVFELLGLAFGLNPFGNGQTMRQITGSIGRIFSQVTSPWLSTLVVAAGIWLAYKGLIKRELGASVAGTLAAVAMLIVGLWVVHSPAQTVGKVANMSNGVALGVISAPQAGSVSRPMGSFAESMSRTWPRLVEVPFAGLNFSDVKWAMGPPPQEAVEKANEKLCDDVGTQALFEAATDSDGDVDRACEEYVQKRYGKPKRVIDLYLRSSPNSPPREALWEYFDKDEADLYKAKVAAQGGDGVLTRLSMLALFLVGLLGAVLLLAWIALRLFMQAAIAFVLLLAAPFALFFPLLGESGRKAFKTWGLTLLGASIAKVIYAALLSIVLLGIAILGRPDGAVGFLLTSAFCWAVFLKRLDLVGWLSVGNGEEHRQHSIGAHFAAHSIGRWVWGTATGTVGGMATMPRRTAPQRPGGSLPDAPRGGPAMDGRSLGARGLTDRQFSASPNPVTRPRPGRRSKPPREPSSNPASPKEARPKRRTEKAGDREVRRPDRAQREEATPAPAGERKRSERAERGREQAPGPRLSPSEQVELDVTEPRPARSPLNASARDLTPRDRLERVDGPRDPAAAGPRPGSEEPLPPRGPNRSDVPRAGAPVRYDPEDMGGRGRERDLQQPSDAEEKPEPEPGRGRHIEERSRHRLESGSRRARLDRLQRRRDKELSRRHMSRGG